MMFSPEVEAKIKCYSKAELINLYGIDRKTFAAWLLPFAEEINSKKFSKYYTPKQVRIIFEKLDPPQFKKGKPKQ